MNYKAIIFSSLLMCSLTAQANNVNFDCPTSKKVELSDILSSSDLTSGRTFKDFQTPAVDYSKIDALWSSEVKRLQDQIPVHHLDVIAPDYQRAITKFRQDSVESLNLYFKHLHLIRLNTEKKLVPLFSQLKALETASMEDNTGIIAEGHAREISRIGDTFKIVQAENQKIYEKALKTLIEPTDISEYNSKTFSSCQTFICAKLLKKDFISYRQHMDQYLVDLNFENIIHRADHFLNSTAVQLNTFSSFFKNKVHEDSLNLKNTEQKSGDLFNAIIRSIEKSADTLASKLPTAILQTGESKGKDISGQKPCIELTEANTKGLNLIIQTPKSPRLPSGMTHGSRGE